MHCSAIFAYSVGVGLGCWAKKWVDMYRTNRAFSRVDISLFVIATSRSAGYAFGIMNLDTLTFLGAA